MNAEEFVYFSYLMITAILAANRITPLGTGITVAIGFVIPFLPLLLVHLLIDASAINASALITLTVLTGAMYVLWIWRLPRYLS